MIMMYRAGISSVKSLSNYYYRSWIRLGDVQFTWSVLGDTHQLNGSITVYHMRSFINVMQSGSRSNLC